MCHSVSSVILYFLLTALYLVRHSSMAHTVTADQGTESGLPYLPPDLEEQGFLPHIGSQHRQGLRALFITRLYLFLLYTLFISPCCAIFTTKFSNCCFSCKLNITILANSLNSNITAHCFCMLLVVALCCFMLQRQSKKY